MQLVYTNGLVQKSFAVFSRVERRSDHPSGAFLLRLLKTLVNFFMHRMHFSTCTLYACRAYSIPQAHDSQGMGPMTYRFDVIAKQVGTTFGFHTEEDGDDYSAAHTALRARLIRQGFSIVKIRRAA